MRPRVYDFEVVTAVGKVRTPAHHSHVADGEVMVAPEMIMKMSVVDTLHMLIVPDFRLRMLVMLYLVVMSLFLPFFFLVMFVLRESCDRSRQQECGTNSPNCNESLHVNLV